MPGTVSCSRAHLRSAGAMRTKKQSLLSKLKSALLRVGSHRHDQGSKDEVFACHSGGKRRAKKSQLEDDIFPPETLGGMSDPELNSDVEDDDISVISLGEARQLAQLRIDGIGVTSIAPPSPCKIDDSLSKPSSTSTVPEKKTGALPPIEPVYHKKAVSVLKKALKTKVSDSKSSIAATSKKPSKKQLKEQSEKKEIAKREAKERKEQMKVTKRMKKLKSWLNRKMGKSATVTAPLAAKEHAKVADLHRRISELEQKKTAKQQQLTQLKNGGHDSKSQVKKMTKSLKSSERKLRKLKSELQTWEDKIKQITGEPSTIGQSGQAATGSRAVSDTNTYATGSQGPKVNTATREPKVVMVRPESTTNFPSTRPCTAVRNFLSCDQTATSEPQISFGLTTRPKTGARKCQPSSDRTTITSRERMALEMMRVEQKAREALYGEGERPSTVVFSRAQTLAEGIQALVPGDLQYFEDEDFERGLPYGEQKPCWQRGGRWTPDENGEMRWEWNLETETEEESDEEDEYYDEYEVPSFWNPLAGLEVPIKFESPQNGNSSSQVDSPQVDSSQDTGSENESTKRRPWTVSYKVVETDSEDDDIEYTELPIECTGGGPSTRPNTRAKSGRPRTSRGPPSRARPPTRSRPPTRCTNAMAKQILQANK